MRNIFRGTTTPIPASTGKTISRTPDILDVLLKMSAREAKEFMDTIEKDKNEPAVSAEPKPKNKVAAKYDTAEKVSGFLILC